MSFEIKVIDGLTEFFSRVQLSAANAVHELKFMKYNLMFGERDDDIYVATYAKSGTTWMQMILYQLTTAGDMNFSHIYEVSPWLRNLAETEGQLPQLPAPRIIKTHDPYHKINKSRKGRYIYIIRDGRDVAMSLFHHRKNFNLRGLTFSENYNLLFREEGDMNWFKFNFEWLANKKQLPVLYVHYEDLLTDFDASLIKIAHFLNIHVNPADLPRIKERTSFRYMKLHEKKFGEQPKNEPDRIYDQFIRAGQAGQGTEAMDQEQRDFFHSRFSETVGRFPQMERYS
jgi:hypothetical protein